jgi:hypothetical protein
MPIPSRRSRRACTGRPMSGGSKNSMKRYRLTGVRRSRSSAGSRLHDTPSTPGAAYSSRTRLALTHIFPTQLASILLPSTCPVGAASRPCSPFAAYLLRQSTRQSCGFFFPITARSNPACLNILLGVHPCSYRLTAVMVKSSWYVMDFSLHLATLPVCSMASICSWVHMRLLIDVVWITRPQNAKKWTLSCPLFGVQIKSECFSLRMLAPPPTRFKPMRGFIIRVLASLWARA